MEDSSGLMIIGCTMNLSLLFWTSEETGDPRYKEIAIRHAGTALPDFGATLHQNIYEWFQQEENWYFWAELRNHVTIAPPPVPPEPVASGNPFVGKTTVVTGKVELYTRDGINAKIESLGAHASSSVSSKTDYLVCGENTGSKLAKARSLGVAVLTPAQFFQMAGE